MIDSLQRVDARHAAKLETQHDGFVVLTSVTHVLANQHKVRPESSAQEWENICRYFIFQSATHTHQMDTQQEKKENPPKKRSPNHKFLRVWNCLLNASSSLCLVRDSIIVTPTYERTFVLVDLCVSRQTRKIGQQRKQNKRGTPRKRNSILAGHFETSWRSSNGLLARKRT